MTGPREVYRTTRKVPDLLWNRYAARPVAAVVVSLLEHTRVTPNQVTLASLIVACAAGGAFVFAPGYLGLVGAAVLFQASYVLDCADGMLARLRKLASPEGHLLDFLIDEIKAFVVLSSVSVRLFLEAGDARMLVLGLAGLVCLASGVALTTFLRRPEIAGIGAASDSVARPPDARPVLLRVPESVAKLAIHYPSYILFAALAGHIELYFFPYVAVNALYMLVALAGVTRRFGRAQPR